VTERELKITEERTEFGIKLTAEGSVNTETMNIFYKALDNVLKAGYYHIVLNMSKVNYLTSNGIRAILKTYKQCSEAGGKFRIESPSERVVNVLGLSALEQMLS